MQFEDFDKKIIEAADHHHPAYDEQAWAKMEKLLNKHMPVKKDRRRGVIFFLLFLALLTGGTFYYFNGRGSSSDKVIADKEGSTQQSTSAKATADEPETRNAQPASAKATADKPATRNAQPASAKTTADKPATSNPQSASANTNDRNTTDRPVPAEQAGTAKVNSTLLKQTYDHAVQDAFNAKLEQQRRTNVSSRQNGNKGAGKLLADIAPGLQQGQQGSGAISVTNTSGKPDQSARMNAAEPGIGYDGLMTQFKPETQHKIAITRNDQRIQIPQLNISQPSVSNTKKSAPKVRSTFFISASGGPDVSVVGVSNTGTVKLVGGGGLGYTFKGRFTLRTGFYTAHKVYTASPDQYHPPASFWNYYPNLQKVDADCKVYEIPLLFTYNFAKKGNANWFAGTGVSSYLMKKETYNYFYKNSAGINSTRKYTLLDKNHHYFSVLTLSAGYQRSIGKGLFVTAEPYFKVPLSGIGYGKINLNGAGVLFSAGWAPFHAKKTNSASH